MTASRNRIDFLRTPTGIKLIGGKFSMHVTFDEIYQLNAFITTGARASTKKIEQNWERSTLRSAPLRELEQELDRRAALRDARLERATEDSDNVE